MADGIWKKNLQGDVTVSDAAGEEKYIFRIKAAKNAAQQNINSNKTKAVKV